MTMSLFYHVAGYIAEGLAKRESVIIIATPRHLSRLAHLLGNNGVDLMRPLAEDRYIALDAGVALSCFMVDQSPNEEMFASLVGYLIKRASKSGRHVPSVLRDVGASLGGRKLGGDGAVGTPLEPVLSGPWVLPALLLSESGIHQ